MKWDNKSGRAVSFEKGECMCLSIEDINSKGISKVFWVIDKSITSCSVLVLIFRGVFSFLILFDNCIFNSLNKNLILYYNTFFLIHQKDSLCLQNSQKYIKISIVRTAGILCFFIFYQII